MANTFYTRINAWYRDGYRPAINSVKDKATIYKAGACLKANHISFRRTNTSIGATLWVMADEIDRAKDVLEHELG